MLVQGKLITVWSSRGNMGSTFTAINLAKTLSKHKGKTVLVDLNLVEPRITEYLNLSDMSHTIDNLYPFAMGKNLTEDIVVANCEMVDDLYVLKGTLNPSSSDFVKPEILDFIIKVLKDSFTYIIIDVHHSLNNSGTYVSLQHSDEVFILMHRDLISILSLYNLKSVLFSLFSEDKFKLLFNKEHESIFLPHEDVEKNLKLESIGRLPLIDNIYNIINKGEFTKIETKKEFKAYSAALNKIIKEYITDSEMKVKKKRKFSLFKKQ